MMAIRSLWDIVRIICIFKWRALNSFLFVMVAIIGLLFIVPPKYQSKAKILVNLGRTNAALPIEVQDRQTAIAQNYRRDYLLDETQLLTSDLIINQLVQRWSPTLMQKRQPTSWFGHVKAFLRERAEDVADWFSDQLVWLGLLDQRTVASRLKYLLTRAISVDHENGAAVLDVTLTLKDPKLANEILADWIRTYLAERLKTPNGTRLRDFYQSQVESIQAVIARLEAERSSIEHRLGTSDLSKRELALSTRIDALSTERAQNLADIGGAKVKLVSSKEALRQLPGYVAAEYVFGENPTVRDLTTRLDNLLVERQAQLRLYAPDARPIAQLDKSIQEVRNWIKQDKKTTGVGETRKINPLATRLNDDIVRNRIKLAELVAKEDSLSKQIVDLDQQRRAVLDAKTRVQDLDRRLSAANQNFRLFSEQLEKARIDVELDLQRIGSARVIQPASFNPTRTFPRTALLLGVSPGIGLAFALFILYISALLDRRIYDGNTLQRHLDLPLLATIPEIEEETSAAALAAKRLASIELARLAYRLGELFRERPAILAFTSARHDEGVSFVTSKLREFVGDGFMPCTRSSGRGIATNIVDAPPIEVANLSLPVLAAADQIVLVVEAGATTFPIAEAAIETLRKAFGEKLLGVVLNRQRQYIPDWLYRVTG
jgi:uncharacterized protein involved in exopolysaccharide biosynthesis